MSINEQAANEVRDALIAVARKFHVDYETVCEDPDPKRESGEWVIGVLMDAIQHVSMYGLDASEGATRFMEFCQSERNKRRARDEEIKRGLRTVKFEHLLPGDKATIRELGQWLALSPWDADDDSGEWANQAIFAEQIDPMLQKWQRVGIENIEVDGEPAHITGAICDLIEAEARATRRGWGEL